MVARAVVRYVRVSSRKVRAVIEVVRGEPAGKALAVLVSINKRAAVPIRRVLQSALANARNKDRRFNADNLYISRIIAQEGPTLKRYRAAPMGRAVRIRRRTSHIIVELDEIGRKA